MIGTRAISGSPAIKLRKRSMASLDSSMPSSILISMIWAPFSTCSRATSKAVVKSSSTIRRLKRAEPVTLVRSPTLTNSESVSILNGSRPDKRQARLRSGIERGAISRTESAIARICSGVEPQQPPIILTSPLEANSLTISDISCGVWSYSPNSLGRPALGCAETKVSALDESSSR